MRKFFLDSIIMLIFGETKKIYDAKKPKNIQNVSIDNIVISKLVETKVSSKYLIGYLDKVIRPLVLVLPKIVDMLRHDLHLGWR